MTTPGSIRPASVPRSPSLRVAASPAGDWVAVADSASGILVLARGHGRALPMAAALPGVIDSAIATSFADPPEEGLPAQVAAVVRLFRAAHQDLRQSNGGHGHELEVLAALTVQGRVFVVQAGAAVRCLRWRHRRWELLAPIGERLRPALGAEPRALIEVVSEPFREGDLVLALTPGDAGRVESAARSAIAAWAERPFEIMPRVPGELAWAALVRGEIAPSELEMTAVTRDQNEPEPTPRNPLSSRVTSPLTPRVSPAISPPAHPSDSSVPSEIGSGALQPAAGQSAHEGDVFNLDFLPPIDLQEADLEDPAFDYEVPRELAGAGVGASAGAGAGEIPPFTRSSGARHERGTGRLRAPANVWRHLRQFGGPGIMLTAALVMGLVVFISKDEIGERLPKWIPWPRSADLEPLDSGSTQLLDSGSTPHPLSAGLGGSAGVATEILIDPDSNADEKEITSPPGYGAVTATTDPAAPQIEVFLDDRSVGVAPVVLDRVAPGRHRIRYRGPENYHWEEEVMVRQGEVARAIAPIDRGDDLAFVTVESTTLSEEGFEEESGDRVMIDGKPSGKTPLDIELPPGVHSIAVQRDDTPPIVRVIELRRSERIKFDVRVDVPPLFTIEHKVPAEGRAGENLLLTATCDGLESSSTPKLYLHYATGDTWNRLPMGEVPGALGTYVIGLPIGPENAGRTLRYYFSIPMGSGEQPIYSSLFSTAIR